ncbi:uncharacterized protein LOC120263619 [Dioscorea cayenensis subsp. rotundata]|uniref:Uncharacterized protein LOC120263619 n=1 Tax=Dioscorea cayennensis subsp. rotundata TaxID=55577 RepID=A0AB40BJU0_DIOCR|nr:uncharacterized protein LOC120263619 [Dioscorea cayenensis subsp. rotundata]
MLLKGEKLLRLIQPRHCRWFLRINRGFMALNKNAVTCFSCFQGFSHLSNASDNHKLISTRHWVNMGTASRPGFETALSVKCSMDHHNALPRKFEDDDRDRDHELARAYAAAPYSLLLSDSDVIPRRDLGSKVVNEHGASRHGRPLGFLEHTMPKKMVVAVDVDEVLGSFLSALNKFIADRYSSNHSLSEYHVYEFFKIWNCTRAEADIRVHEFFKTPYFKKGIHPIPGARLTLEKLSTFCDLSVVTSRQNAIKDLTLEWIGEHYPGLFQEVHFGNHFALDGQSRSKSEICRSLGAQVLIDDNPRYALECAEVGLKVLLFDYNNSYPWSKSDSAVSHPLVTKVHNWQEVEQTLASWILS